MGINFQGIGSNGMPRNTQKVIQNSKNNFSALIHQSAETDVNRSKGSFPYVKQNEAQMPIQNTSGSLSAFQGTRQRESIQLSGNVPITGNKQERLEQIRKLNAETDWASMSDVEKVRTFENRYRQAFGDEKYFLTAGLYMGYSDSYDEVYVSYVEDMEKYFSKDGPAKLSSTYQNCYREAFYGSLTKDEVRLEIQKKWQGTGAMEDKFAILQEFARCDVDYPVESTLINQISWDVFAKVENLLRPSIIGTGMSPTDHPRFTEYFMTYAKGVGEGTDFKPNWTQLAQSNMITYENMSRMKENNITLEDLQERRDLLDEFLKDILREE